MSSNHNDELKRSAFGSMIWKMSERVCTQLVSTAISIVLARMLMPEDYSVVSIVWIFFAFCNIFISGGINSALIQKKDADEEDYSTVLCLNLFAAAIVYGIMFFCAPLIAEAYGKSLLILLIRVMGLTFFVSALNAVLSAYTSKHLQFKRFFMASTTGTVLSAFVGIWMAFRGMGPWALVGQQMTDLIVDTFFLYFSCRLRVKLRFSWQRIKGLFAYGGKILVSSIVAVIYDQISPLVVGLRFTTADLAYYDKGRSFPGLISSSISDTLTAVLFPVMAQVQDNKEDILNITRRYVKISSFVIFPCMVGLSAVAEKFVLVLLTEKWLPAVPFMWIFALCDMFTLVMIGNLQAIKAIGRSDIILILEILKKSIYFVVIGLFVFFSKDARIFAISAVCCTAVALAINTFPNRKLLGYSYRYQLADLMPNLLISLAMGAVVLLVGQLSLTAYLLLPAQIAAGIAAYVGLSILTRNENFYYLLNFLLQFLKRG